MQICEPALSLEGPIVHSHADALNRMRATERTAEGASGVVQEEEEEEEKEEEEGREEAIWGWVRVAWVRQLEQFLIWVRYPLIEDARPLEMQEAASERPKRRHLER